MAESANRSGRVVATRAGRAPRKKRQVRRQWRRRRPRVRLRQRAESESPARRKVQRREARLGSCLGQPGARAVPARPRQERAHSASRERETKPRQARRRIRSPPQPSALNWRCLRAQMRLSSRLPNLPRALRRRRHLSEAICAVEQKPVGPQQETEFRARARARAAGRGRARALR